MKERVTLTIEKGVLEKVDNSVNGIDVKNRSHAVELLLTKAFGENKPSKAVILAGGKGARMKPMTNFLPKPMLRINDKPILEHNIELLKRHGIKDIIISVGHKGDKIKEYFGDGSQLGVNISYVEEEAPLGTGGPLTLLKDKVDSTFILMNGDELKDIDLEDMFMFHRKNKGVATIALTTAEDPSSYGVAVMNGNRIMTFIEKPNKKAAPSNLISAGLYIFEPEVLKMVPEGFSMVENYVFPRLASNDKLLGYVFSGQWFDTGTPERFSNAEREWEGLK
ncbi:MAG: nucleotidyltransferase family protein [Nanoarchaeota archaeon]|nr:nucleotidyltransferase family protein [Nanoarchaeota archaeon]MBU1321457.1 nucleotidyltransferase family protein [Nanoarchaeota archaeon]MBU1596913.1 nucleotidyltransferase family protein [Nanoarchaeota archaeon]MBU2441550.1 nucleotidyltransferase family protein [Nanoarchaeota archaeon]